MQCYLYVVCSFFLNSFSYLSIVDPVADIEDLKVKKKRVLELLG